MIFDEHSHLLKHSNIKVWLCLLALRTKAHLFFDKSI
jgi:hypothetical protein